MNAATKIAITKSVNSSLTKAARKELSPGTYEIDAIVQVQGVLTVGDDGQRAGTSRLLSEEGLAMILHFAGITRDAAINAIVEAANLVDAGDKAARQQVLEQFDKDGKVSQKIKDIKAELPMIATKGRVAFKGEAAELELADDDVKVVKVA